MFVTIVGKAQTIHLERSTLSFSIIHEIKVNAFLLDRVILRKRICATGFKIPFWDANSIFLFVIIFLYLFTYCAMIYTERLNQSITMEIPQELPLDIFI